MSKIDSVIAAFNAMDDETQEVALGVFLSLARDFPRAKKLHLVHRIAVAPVAGHTSSHGPYPLLVLR